MYGLELIIDMHNCNITKFNRKSIRVFCSELCDLIDMEAETIYFWDDYRIPKELRQTNPKTKGTSAIQFILTSNITIHTLDILGDVYVNIFSCKDFNIKDATDFTVKYFGAKEFKFTLVERGVF